MKKGMMIATNMGGKASAVWVEEEVLEQSLLNRRTKDRIRKAEQEEKRTRKQVSKHNRRLQKLVVRVASTVAAAAGVAMALAVELMAPVLGISLLVAAMVYVSFLLGQHLGRCCR